jgi:two-component system LytT family response regulator
VILCEPDHLVRKQVRLFIESDPLLTLAAECADWAECEVELDELLPELLIARAELIPAEWVAGNDNFPVVILLRNGDNATSISPQHNALAVPVGSDAVKRSLNQAIRDIYDRKAKQLLYLVDRYVSGSASASNYRSAVRVERDGRPFDLHISKVLSIVAARKCVSVHSVNGNFMLREPIHLVAERLDPRSFIRIHRSIIINCQHLDRTAPPDARSSHVVLTDGSRYPVGASYREALENAMQHPINPFSVS